MNKKSLLGIAIIFLGVLFVIIKLVILPEENKIQEEENKDNYENKEVGDEIMSKVNINIEGIDYVINLEDNETAKEFVDILPINLTMNELNGNEKYVYLDKSFTTNTYNPNTVNAGDVMLYGNNCLVIFYKTFNTSYSYTKIGHIDNLEYLGSENINVSISK